MYGKSRIKWKIEMKKWIAGLGVLFSISMSSLSCDVGYDPIGLVAGWSSFIVKDWEHMSAIPVYINGRNERVEVKYAEKEMKFQSEPLHRNVIQTFASYFDRLSREIPLRFTQVSDANQATLMVYGVCMSHDKKGLVAESLTGSRQLIILNTCMDFSEDEFNQLFLHELGHALGLKHPFDDATGVCIYTNRSHAKNSATLDDTVMAYKESSSKIVPVWYQPLDIKALHLVWADKSKKKEAVQLKGEADKANKIHFRTE